jgi:hypothetical protein
MRRFLLIPIAFVALAIPVAVFAAGGDSGFNGIVHSIEGRYHVHATHIPFMGLISLISRGATHGGFGGLHIAEFDSFTESVDGNELNQMVEEKLGAGWERMIRETSKKGNEQTLIFTHGEGARMCLLIVNLEGDEMNIVQVSVDPKHLDDDIGQYSHHHRDQDPGSQEHSD